MRSMRLVTVVLAAAAFALAIGCESDGGADPDPVCDPTQCQALVDGACQSVCSADSSCVQGECVAAGTCTPTCDATLCMVCADSACVSSCSPGTTCVSGVCRVVDDTCTPACDATQCLFCEGGTCASACTGGQTCQNGQCIDPNACTPACDATQCLTCEGGQCVTACDPGEQCVAGQCTPESGDCSPACDPALCETCVDGACTSLCQAGETCQAGQCVGETTCSPGCEAASCEACVDGACQSTCVGSETCQNGQCLVPGSIPVQAITDDTRQDHPTQDTEVTVSGMIVTAIDTNGSTTGSFWIQHPDGGAYSGIRVFNEDGAVDTGMLQVGMRVAVTGTYTENFGNAEIHLGTFEVIGSAILPLAPTVVPVADLARDGGPGEEWEGVLVTVEDVTVTDANPDAPDNDYGEFVIDGALRVDDDLYLVDPAEGDTFASLTGVMTYSFGDRKLLPRSADDVEGGPSCEGDRDCDGVADDVDNCPDTPNEDQANSDGDDLGDACDQAAVTIRTIQDPDASGRPAEGAEVTLSGVVVTAIDTNGPSGEGSFWVQDVGGGAWSGVYVYNRPNAPVDVSGIGLGDKVDVTGVFAEYQELTEIELVSVTFVASAATAPEPTVVDPVRIATGGLDAEKYEGCLVRVENVTVTSENPDGPDNDYNEWQVANHLRVDDELYFHDAAMGASFASLTGVLHYRHDHFKLLPRGPQDVVPAAGK